MVKKRGLQVTTGSGNSVHKFTDDGTVVLGANSTSNEIAVSGSTHFGDKDLDNSLTDQGVIASGMFRVPMYDSGSEGDISILNSLAASPSSYNGYIMYLSSSGVVSGGVASGGTVKVSNDAGQYFARGPAVYFCRNGNWFHDTQVKVTVSSGGGGGAVATVAFPSFNKLSAESDGPNLFTSASVTHTYMSPADNNSYAISIGASDGSDWNSLIGPTQNSGWATISFWAKQYKEDDAGTESTYFAFSTDNRHKAFQVQGGDLYSASKSESGSYVAWCDRWGGNDIIWKFYELPNYNRLYTWHNFVLSWKNSEEYGDVEDPKLWINGVRANSPTKDGSTGAGSTTIGFEGALSLGKPNNAGTVRTLQALRYNHLGLWNMEGTDAMATALWNQGRIADRSTYESSNIVGYWNLETTSSENIWPAAVGSLVGSQVAGYAHPTQTTSNAPSSHPIQPAERRNSDIFFTHGGTRGGRQQWHWFQETPDIAVARNSARAASAGGGTTLQIFERDGVSYRSTGVIPTRSGTGYDLDFGFHWTGGENRYLNMGGFAYDKSTATIYFLARDLNNLSDEDTGGRTAASTGYYGTTSGQHNTNVSLWKLTKTNGSWPSVPTKVGVCESWPTVQPSTRWTDAAGQRSIAFVNGELVVWRPDSVNDYYNANYSSASYAVVDTSDGSTKMYVSCSVAANSLYARQDYSFGDGTRAGSRGSVSAASLILNASGTAFCHLGYSASYSTTATDRVWKVQFYESSSAQGGFYISDYLETDLQYRRNNNSSPAGEFDGQGNWHDSGMAAFNDKYFIIGAPTGRLNTSDAKDGSRVHIYKKGATWAESTKIMDVFYKDFYANTSSFAVTNMNNNTSGRFFGNSVTINNANDITIGHPYEDYDIVADAADTSSQAEKARGILFYLTSSVADPSNASDWTLVGELTASAQGEVEQSHDGKSHLAFGAYAVHGDAGLLVGHVAAWLGNADRDGVEGADPTVSTRGNKLGLRYFPLSGAAHT